MAAINTGDGRKAAKQLRFYMTYVLSVIVITIFVIGMVDFIA